MKTSDIKFLLYKEIDKLPKEVLMELKDIIEKLVKKAGNRSKKQPKRHFGSMKGLVEYMSPDFNAPLEEFKEYTSE